MSESTHGAGPAGDESYEAPASDADGEESDEEAARETATPFASGGGTNVPGARTDEPRDPDEPQRSE